MQQVFAWNQLSLEHHDLPGATALLQLAEIPDTVSPIHDPARVVDRLILYFDDLAKSDNPAKQAWDFIDRNKDVPHLCIQCIQGVERSHATVAAIFKDRGIDNSPILLHGSYTRKWYQELLRERHIPLEREPLVSIIVSTYNNLDRLKFTHLSMKFQRYDNWELVIVTDGPHPAARKWIEEEKPEKVVLVETPETKSHWGSCWRQLGINAAKGEFINFALDDNYLTPGFIEQMVGAIQHLKADAAVCDCAHHYAGFGVWPHCKAWPAYMIRSELVREIGWTESSIYAEGHFLDAVHLASKHGIVHVPRALVVHC